MSTALSAQPITPARPYGLTLYFGVAFVLSWIIMGLAVLAAQGIIAPLAPAQAMIGIATLGPILAAILVTAYESGGAGVRALLGQLRRWRARPIWYGVALLGPGLVMAVAFLLWRALGGPALDAPPLWTWLTIPLAIAGLAIAGAFEEVGWRGYAFPRLQQRFGALVGSLLLGIVHGLFHLPVWFIPGMGFDELPYPAYALLTLAIAILFAWILNSTGSLLLVCLAHGAINAYPLPWGTALMALPEGTRGLNIQIAVAIVLAVGAVLVILFTNPRTLTRKSA